MLKAIEVIIEPNGVIRPLEALHVTTPTRAILTLLETQPQPDQPEKGSGASILQFLQNHPLPPEHRRTAAEIDQQINEERSAWD
jgi:hypothetical protein